MKLNANFIAAFLIPSLLLWLSAFESKVSRPTTRTELFGNENAYLSVSYDRLIQSRHPSEKFEVQFADLNGEHRARGKRYRVAGKWVYEFSSSVGHFIGALTPNQGRCEPELVYKWTTPVGIKSGSMRAGFCGPSEKPEKPEKPSLIKAVN